MATKIMALAVAATLLPMLVLAQNCPAVTQFAACLPYVNSPNAGNPPRGGSCCQLVKSLTATCLCNAATNSIPGVKIDFKKALTLPKACGRYVPPHTTCNEFLNALFPYGEVS